MFCCTDFTNAILTNVNLTNTNLNGALFCKTDMQGVDFEIQPDLIGHYDAVMFVNFSHDEKYIVSGDKSGNIRIWSFETSKEISNFKGHNEEITIIKFSPDSKYIVSGDKSGNIRIWSIETSKEISNLKGHLG